MGMIFLISSLGFMVYKSNCSCTGTEYTSLFVPPATCETELDTHDHCHDDQKNVCSEDECNECTDPTKSCGCDTPEFFFFKLKDKAIDDEVNFVSVQSLELFVASTEIPEELNVKNKNSGNPNLHISPPPIITSSLEFLILINQLKIPSLA